MYNPQVCGVSGAAVGCNAAGCKANFHFLCARTAGCVFQLDKKVYCRYHHILADGRVSKLHTWCMASLCCISNCQQISYQMHYLAKQKAGVKQLCY